MSLGTGLDSAAAGAGAGAPAGDTDHNARGSDVSSGNNTPVNANTNANACPTCKKVFSRIAHLRRHLASHDGTPRWRCDFCGSTFQRRDALSRHLNTCGKAASGARVQSRLANRACNPCRDRKVRCNSALPCACCSSARLECTYSLRRERHGSTARPMEVMPSPSPSTAASMSDHVPLDQADTVHVATTAYHPTHNHSSPGPDPDSAIHQTTVSCSVAGGPVDEAWMSVDPSWASEDPFNLFQAFSWTAMGQAAVPSQSSHMLELASDRAIGIPGPSNSGAHEMQPVFVDEHASSPCLSLQPWPVASGLTLVQLDPLEHHRSKITAYLEAKCAEVADILTLFRSQSLGVIINTYFLRHHRHTPIIHLPTWNIASSSTALVLAMSLIAASHTPSLQLRSSHIRPLLSTAYSFVVESDPNVQSGGPSTLETLQAMLLLVILERLMTSRQESLEPVIAFDGIIRIARRAGLFNNTTPNSAARYESEWKNWVVIEASRRLAFIFYALDCLLTVLSDEVPSISTYDMQLHLPQPETLYEASSEAEWKRLRETTDLNQQTLFSVLMELLLSGLLDPSHLPRTLMGKFAVIHGILCYSWQTKRQYEMVRLHGDPAGTSARLFECRTNDVRAALALWHTTWPITTAADNNDAIHSSNGPVLYKDRGLAWLYLAGAFTLHECKIAAGWQGSRPSGMIPVCAFLQGLVAMLDRGQLESLGLDYATIHHFVVDSVRGHANRVSIGSLMYREPDSVTPGFS